LGGGEIDRGIGLIEMSLTDRDLNYAGLTYAGLTYTSRFNVCTTKSIICPSSAKEIDKEARPDMNVSVKLSSKLNTLILDGQIYTGKS
jgi:hypothetical protein